MLLCGGMGLSRVFMEFIVRSLVSILSFLVLLTCLEVLGFEHVESIMVSICYTLSLIISSRYRVRVSSRLLVNIGGAVVPLITALSLTAMIVEDTIWPIYTLILGLSTAIVYLSSQYIPGRGIGLPFILPVIAIASLVSLYIDLYREPILYSIPIAYTVAVYSTLIGADLLRTIQVIRKGITLEIGGDGLLDLIVLSSTITPPITVALLIIGNQ